MYLTDATARVHALLDARESSLAAQHIASEQALVSGRKFRGRELDLLRTRLRLLLLENDWHAIKTVRCPDDVPQHERPAANEIIQFFQGIAEIENPSGDSAMAAQIFEGFLRKHPTVAGYGTNFFAAELRSLLSAEGFPVLEGPSARRGQRLLAKADQLANSLVFASPHDRDLFEINRAALLLALGKPDGASQTLRAIQTPSLRDSVVAYSALALFRLGQHSEALALLSTAGDSRSPILEAATAYLSGRIQISSVPVRVSLDDDQLQSVALALHKLKSMPPHLQARVVHYPTALESLVFDVLQITAAAITALVPMMKRFQVDKSEDDLTSLLETILTSRCSYLGWSVHNNTRAGFSEKANAGRPDLLLKSESLTIAALEAVRCEDDVATFSMQRNFISHFRKLLGYSTGDLFVYLVYNYSKNDTVSTLKALQAIASSEPPPSFEYSGNTVLNRGDSAPPGFIAKYREGGREISVLFLILDLVQASQLEAAKAAAAARTKRKNSGLP